MNVVQRIVKNSGTLFISSIFSGILGFLSVTYAAQYLGPERFGILAFAVAFTSILGVISDIGLGQLTVREVSRNKTLAQKYFSNIGTLQIISGVFTLLTIAILINWLGYEPQTIHIVYIFGFTAVFNAFIRMCNAFFKSFESMEYISVGQTLNNLLIFVGVILAIHFRLELKAFAILYCLCTIATLGLSLVILKYRFNEFIPNLSTRALDIHWPFCKTLLKEALPFFLSTIVTVIAFKIDIVMLSKMKGDTVVGWYGAAFNIIEVLMFIPIALGGAIYPVLSERFLSSYASLGRIYNYSFKYLLILALPLATGITLLAPKLILFIYHTDYTPSITALQILIWTTPIIFLTSTYGIILASIDKQPLSLAINTACMFLNIILNFIIIPRYSLIGASITTILTSLLSLVLCYYYISKLICRISIMKYVYKPAIASALMGLMILLLKEYNLFINILTGIGVYGVIIVLLKTFSQQDRDMFRKVIPFR